jgi:hypothetical protein
MKIPHQRFNNLLEKAEMLLSKAGKEANPALWLYQNDLRTPMFRLQALARIYREFHDEEIFGKLKDKFKQVEDGIGKIDHYAAFVKDPAVTGYPANLSTSAAIKDFCYSKTNENAKVLQAILEDENWLDGKCINKIKNKLDAADWLSPEDEYKELKKFYKEEIEEINEFITETTLDFDNVEEDVHELRRKLRWLSIYAQALQGAVQLSADEKADERLIKYLTPAVVQSPFNTMLPASEGVKPLTLNRDSFLALSWFINELGNLKDKGLKLVMLQEVFVATEKLDEDSAMQKAVEVAGNGGLDMHTILKDASAAARQFFNDKVIDSLVKQQ